MAVLTDDVNEVRRVDQAIQQGNELWRSFALRVGGSVVEIGGDEGRIQFGADHLGELPDVARQYSEVVGATVSVGVGLKLSDSAKALMVSKLRGGDQILLWDPSMEADIKAAQEHPQTEKDKLAEEYLTKADAGPEAGPPAPKKDEHAGFKGAQTGEKGMQGDHKEGAAAAKMINNAQESQPDQVEGTHAAKDFEAMLHEQAQQQGQDDQNDEVDESGRVEQIKQQVAQTLLQIRAQMPVIAQIQQASPETYQAIMNLVNGVIALGREVMTQAEVPADDEPAHVQEAVRKAESARPFVPESEFDPAKAGEDGYVSNYVRPDWKERVSMVEPGTKFDDYDWKYHPDFDTSQMGDTSGYKTYLNDERREAHDDYEHPVDSDPYAHFGDWLKSPQRQPVVLFHGSKGIQPADGSHRLGYAAEKGVTKMPAIVGTMKKNSSGPIPGEKNRLNLPVGSAVNGKVKVQHADGKQGWKGVRSGQIQGQEPDAPFIGANSHAVSSREPGSK